MKTNTFFAFLENISRTTWKASAYHRLGTPGLKHQWFYYKIAGVLPTVINRTNDNAKQSDHISMSNNEENQDIVLYDTKLDLFLVRFIHLVFLSTFIHIYIFIHLSSFIHPLNFFVHLRMNHLVGSEASL